MGQKALFLLPYLSEPFFKVRSDVRVVEMYRGISFFDYRPVLSDVLQVTVNLYDVSSYYEIRLFSGDSYLCAERYTVFLQEFDEPSLGLGRMSFG